MPNNSSNLIARIREHQGRGKEQESENQVNSSDEINTEETAKVELMQRFGLQKGRQIDEAFLENIIQQSGSAINALIELDRPRLQQVGFGPSKDLTGQGNI